jgi:hypothetical protein
MQKPAQLAQSAIPARLKLRRAKAAQNQCAKGAARAKMVNTKLLSALPNVIRLAASVLLARLANIC